MTSNHLILCLPLILCPQSFSASGSFAVSWLFASGSQTIGASASALVLPMNIQGWFPLWLTGLISVLPRDFRSVLQHHNSKASILQPSAFFIVQLSHPYMITGVSFTETHFNALNRVSPKSYLWLLLQGPIVNGDWFHSHLLPHAFFRTLVMLFSIRRVISLSLLPPILFKLLPSQLYKTPAGVTDTVEIKFPRFAMSLLVQASLHRIILKNNNPVSE